jgi:hypothetical protein
MAFISHGKKFIIGVLTPVKEKKDISKRLGDAFPFKQIGGFRKDYTIRPYLPTPLEAAFPKLGYCL